MDTRVIIDMGTPEGKARVEQYEREKAATVRRGQQLYAKIKKSSKYYSQNSFAQKEPERWGGFPFAVRIEGNCGDYKVQGGPGGQYRLSDVNLYVIDDGEEIRIS